jgi:hypothetical protein
VRSLATGEKKMETLESPSSVLPGGFNPHQCKHCSALLITGKEIDIPTEQVFDGAENNCAFFIWCLNWNQFPSDSDQLETTQSDATSFRKFSSLQLRLLGEGLRQYVDLLWLKLAPTTGDRTEAKWPEFSNYSKKLLLYADDGQYIPSFFLPDLDTPLLLTHYR